MRPAIRATVVALALILAAAPLAAQTQPAKPVATAKSAAAPKAAPTPVPSPSPTPTEPPPPYEPQLLRLAELMGALSYLRDLCQAGDGAEFHDKMAKLLDAEGRTPERKETLAGAFNRGFDDYQMTYRACTPAAHDVVTRYLDESARIARDLAGRYGG